MGGLRGTTAAVMIAVLSGCAAGGPGTEPSTRLDSSALFFHNDVVTTGDVGAQISALEISAKQLVRHSTINGAVMGAALGCGLTLVSASNAKACVAGATLGGAGGAALGHQAGKRDVARRINLVSSGDVGRSLRQSEAQVTRITADLPAYLGAQEDELNRLTMALTMGEITQAEHDRQALKIARDRADLAHALTLSMQQAKRAEANLTRAAREGQTGLDWHVEAAGELANGIASARGTITLL